MPAVCPYHIEPSINTTSSETIALDSNTKKNDHETTQFIIIHQFKLISNQITIVIDYNTLK
jgi:hypothetical protein